VDGRAECMCKDRVDMARGTRTPQRGRCVSGMELTRARHAVVGVLTDLSFRVPYQPKIGTETQRLKNRTKHLCIYLQCAIFFLFAPRGFAGSFQLAHARAWHSSRTKICPEFTFHPHPHHAALTLAPREQGEGGSDTGERMVSATCLARTLTQMGSPLRAIPGLYC
jgi:hypothetical protein